MSRLSRRLWGEMKDELPEKLLRGGLGENERRPEGDAFGKRTFPSEARGASLLFVRSHYLPSAVFPSIG